MALNSGHRPPRETLLKWFDTLSDVTLFKAWRWVMKMPAESGRQQQIRQREKAILYWRWRHTKPTEDDWYELAGTLKAAGLYSSTTSKSQIVMKAKLIATPANTINRRP